MESQAPVENPYHRLRLSEFFTHLPNPAVEELARRAQWIHLKPTQPLMRPADVPGEGFCFIMEGQLCVAVDQPPPESAPAKQEEPISQQIEFVSFFTARSFFSDGYLDLQPQGPKIVCLAQTECELVRLPIDFLAELLRAHPAWANELAQRNASLRAYYQSQQLQSRRLVQDFFLRYGCSFASTLKVIQLGRCIDCDRCEKACAERHGTSRMSRLGPRLGQLAFPVVCRSCRDRRCLKACRLGAAWYDEQAHEIRINEKCVGCKRCAKVCTNDAVRMIAALPSAKNKQVAIKCEHCAGFKDLACLRACPTGALIEVTPEEIFSDLTREDVEARPNCSEVPFVEGIEEHRARVRGRHHFPWVSVLSLLAIVGVGIECFLRRTMPEISLLYFWNQALGQAGEVGFESGFGFGHWLGYIGTGLMLSTLFYPLKSRLRLFPRISGRAWLDAHVWVGLTGAAFTTFHSAMKMDRWVAVPMVASWLVVLSGAIGRYLYGMVHSGIGLAEFEQRALQEEHRRLLLQWSNREGAEGLFSGKDGSGKIHVGGFLTGVANMMWRDMLGWLRFWWLKSFGLRHIDNVLLRHQTAKLLMEWDRNQRTKRYLERGKQMLKAWNRIHLILTLLMFVLAIVHVVFAFIYKAH